MTCAYFTSFLGYAYDKQARGVSTVTLDRSEIVGGYNTADTVVRDRIQDEVGHEIQWRRFLLNSGGRHGERGARAYTGSLRAEPPAGSRGSAPGQGVRGRSPAEAERKLHFDNTITRLILH